MARGDHHGRSGAGGVDGGPGSGAWMGYGPSGGRRDDSPPPGGDPFGGPSGGGGLYGSPDPLAGMPPLAPSGRRVLARVIDIVIVGIVVWLVSLALGVAAYQINGRMQFGRSFGESLITGVLYIAYDTLLIYRSGQTVGKRLLKLRVANLSDGSTPTFQTSLARAAVLWVPFAFCCAFVWTAITGGWSFFDRPYKQGLHDKAARTVVVSIV
nr:RDD family protein [Streptomyces sp. TS71-3]